MAYIGSSPTKVVSRQSANIFTYTATANQTAFTGADDNSNTLACSPSDIMVHMNGIKLEESDYSASTTTVTLVSGAAAGDEVTITAFLTFESADHYTKSAADTRYFNSSGDTMTDALSIAANNSKISASNNHLILHDTAETDTGSNWWYIYRNSGEAGALRFYRGADRFKIDSSGRVTMPYQPAFRAYSTVSAWTLLSANTWVIAALESEDYDRGSNYNTTNYRFTAPIAGLYQFTLHAYARVQSGGQGDNSYYWTARFGINGQTQGVHCIVGYFSDGDEDNTCTVTSTFNLSANDYVEVYLRGHSSSAEYYRSLCSFEGRLVG